MEVLQQALRDGLYCSKAPQELYEAVKLCSPDELALLGLKAPEPPRVPPNLQRFPPLDRVRLLQEFISSFSYNHTPHTYASVEKNKPFGRIVAAANTVIQTALPIRCIEAVFVGLALSCGWDGFDRYPVGFKTWVEGHVYRHIVLIIHHRPSGKFGAVGLSRRSELAYKPLQYSKASAVLEDYKASYEKYRHKLLKVRIGLPAPHDTLSSAPVCWRYCNVDVARLEWSQAAVIFDEYVGQARGLETSWRVTGNKKNPMDFLGSAAVTAAAAAAAAPRYESPVRKRGGGGEELSGTGRWQDGYYSSESDDGQQPGPGESPGPKGQGRPPDSRAAPGAGAAASRPESTGGVGDGKEEDEPGPGPGVNHSKAEEEAPEAAERRAGGDVAEVPGPSGLGSGSAAASGADPAPAAPVAPAAVAKAKVKKAKGGKGASKFFKASAAGAAPPAITTAPSARDREGSGSPMRASVGRGGLVAIYM